MANTGDVFKAGRVALITGAASGLGLQTALNCAKRGMKVVMADFNAEALPGAEAQVKAVTGADGTLAMVTNVTKPEDWQKLLDATMAKFGDVAFFHNNAGGGSAVSATVWETPAQDWENTLGLNLHGVLNGIRCIIPAMIKGGKPGCIVNTSSGAGATNLAGAGAPYTVAKFGVRLLTETLANDLRRVKAPISAHVLMPMMMATNFGVNLLQTDAAQKGRQDKARANTNKGLTKLGQTPEELAEQMISACITGGTAGSEGANFYIIGTDKQLNPPTFKEMVKWQIEDVVENRPAMSYQMDAFKEPYLKRLRDVRKETRPGSSSTGKPSKL